MAIGRTNAGGGFTKSVIIVTAPTGSTVTCTKGTTVKTATEKNGEWWFKNLDTGQWTLKATLSGQTATQNVSITQLGVYRIAIAYRLTPDFTYSGDCQVVQDNDATISDFANWKGNWKIRFLTSGVFTITNMHGWTSNRVDAFLVGGGGNGYQNNGDASGGAGGYTNTVMSIPVSANTPYQITIGGPSGTTSAFGAKAAGGNNGGMTSGANGGSGSGSLSGTPGADGNDGNKYAPDYPAGQGQRSLPGPNGETGTTREFKSSTGRLYSGAGGGRNSVGTSSPGADGGGGDGGNNTPGTANTGGGGGGGNNYAPGGSGIVVIRNAR